MSDDLLAEVRLRPADCERADLPSPRRHARRRGRRRARPRGARPRRRARSSVAARRSSAGTGSPTAACSHPTALPRARSTSRSSTRRSSCRTRSGSTRRRPIVDVTQNRDSSRRTATSRPTSSASRTCSASRRTSLVYLGGRRMLKTHSIRSAAKSRSTGIAHGTLLRPGHYTLEVGALDLAGNITPVGRARRVHVKLRYIVLASRHIVAHAGKRSRSASRPTRLATLAAREAEGSQRRCRPAPSRARPKRGATCSR